MPLLPKNFSGGEEEERKESDF